MKKHEQLRKQAADTLKALPKSERLAKQEEMFRDPEYWKLRVDKLKEHGQAVEFSEDRTELRWKIKSMYHGTSVPEIDIFSHAEESTIGNNAVYFTIDPELAMGYAQLRKQERKTVSAHLYEVTLRDVVLQNWAEDATVDRLKQDYVAFANQAYVDLGKMNYEAFQKKYDVWPTVQEWVIPVALDRIIELCEKPNTLRGGNVKLVAQGAMGIFFEKFVKEKGYDGVITIEGGDDLVHTARPGISVVLFNREKIASHRSVDITKPQAEL